MKPKIVITKQDLIHAHSMAVNACIQLPKESEYHKDNHNLQAYSYAVAIVSLLNSKSVLDLDIDIKRGMDDVE